jgi:hypothetical protein
MKRTEIKEMICIIAQELYGEKLVDSVELNATIELVQKHLQKLEEQKSKKRKHRTLRNKSFGLGFGSR